MMFVVPTERRYRLVTALNPPALRLRRSSSPIEAAKPG